MCALWLDYSDNWTIHGPTNLWTFNSWTSYGLCLSVSFCVLYAWLQFTADLYRIWHVACIDPLDGH